MKKRSVYLTMSALLIAAALSGCDKKSDSDENSLTATEVAYKMGNGINLGNTMEATGGREAYITDGTIDVKSHETSWGQPETTQEMITGMKEAGYDTLRIPVAWCNMVNIEAGEYTIEQEYIDRVGTIIDYAIEADMYVIVNDHWDSSWWGMFGSKDETVTANAMELYKSIWKQVAEAYADYDYHLILESANEELGDALNDTRFQADSGALSEDECFETANLINQTFVDVVREAGGYNEDRFLLIAGYNTNIDYTCDDRFKMPTDTVDEKLILSVHYYDPWTFCGDDSTGNAWGAISDYEYMNTQFEKLNKFAEAGVPVVIGEYGVLNLMEDEETGEEVEKADTVAYITQLLDLCDYYNYVPVLWDTGALYSRTDCAMRFDDTAKLFKDKSFESQSKMTQEEEKAAAKKEMDASLANAPESLADTDYAAGDASTAIGTIMFQNASWGNAYSVGDTYAPDTSTGIVPTEVEVTGEGTYTVGLDFTKCGGNIGVQFSALAVYNGEILFPGYYMEITSVKINGEEAKTLAECYTTSDDKKCTRVNLYNEWVTSVPEEARKVTGDVSKASAWFIEQKSEKILLETQIDTLEVTFDYVAPESAEAYVADRDSWAAGLE